MDVNGNMLIRNAEMKNLDSISEVESECFPESEAATRKDFEGPLRYYSSHFWLMFDDEKLIAFVDGFVTDEPDLTDEMYGKAEMHNEDGSWQMIFGVNTIPEYRNKGYAGKLIQKVIEYAEIENY